MNFGAKCTIIARDSKKNNANNYEHDYFIPRWEGWEWEGHELKAGHTLHDTGSCAMSPVKDRNSLNPQLQDRTKQSL